MEDTVEQASPLRLVEDTPEWDFEPTAEGHEKGKPSAAELEKLNRRMGAQIKAALNDHKPLFSRVRQNIEAYRGKSLPLSGQDKKEILTPPIVGRVIDQIIAWETVTCLKSRPIVSFDPYEDDSYDVLLPVEVQPQMPVPEMGMGVPEMGMPGMEQNVGMMGGGADIMGGGMPMMQPPAPMQSQAVEPWTSEDIGHNAEIWWDFKLREKYRARQLFKNGFKALHTEGALYGKVVWDKREREAYATKFKKQPGSNLVEILGDEKRMVLDGDPLRVYQVPFFNLVWPIDSDRPQDAEWAAESLPALSEFDMQSARQDKYTLPSDDEWTGVLKNTTTEYRSDAERGLRENLEGLKSANPEPLHDVKEVWFYWPVKVKVLDESGKNKTKIVRMLLTGDFHLGAEKFLCIYKNYYRHGRIPYVVAFEDEENGRRSTACLTEKLSKHQRLAAQMLHITLSNKIKAGNWNPWALEGSPAHNDLSSENFPGKLINGKFGDEWGYAQGGLEHRGLMDEINFVMGDLMETANMSPAQMGASISNRTAAAAVQQVMEAGLLKPVLWLGVMSDWMADVVRLALEVQRQYDPFGETVPFRDPDTRKFIEVQMRFPTEPIFDRFHIALTAAEEELAKEADQAENILVANALRESSMALAQVAGSMSSLDASPEMTNLLNDLLRSELEMRKMVIGHRRRDIKKLVPATSRGEAIVAEKMQAIQIMQQQQQGAMGGGDAATGDQPPVPANGPGGPGAGMAGMA